MAAASPPGDSRGWDYALDVMGLGVRRQRVTEAIAVTGVVVSIICGAGWLYESKASADKVQRFLIPVHPETGLALGQIPLSGAASTTLLDRAYLRAAMDWVSALRSRPNDDIAFNQNLLRLAQMTDARLYQRIGDELEQKRKEFGRSTVEVVEIAPSILERRDNGIARVDVWWTQIKRGGGEVRTRHRATLTLLYRKEETLLDFRRNISGVYVIDAANIVEVK